MSRLTFGADRRQKRRVVGLLVAVNLLALAALVPVFLGAPRGLGPWLGLLGVVAVALWLFSFVLLIVNLAHYLLSRE